MIKVRELERYVHLYSSCNYHRKDRLLSTPKRSLKFWVTSNTLDAIFKKNKNPPELRQIKEYSTILRNRVVHVVDRGDQREWYFGSEERIM